MSFDSHSELQPHLLALTQIAQWHADAHQLPLELRFAVHGGTVNAVHTAITGVVETQAPANYTQVATAAVMDLARIENFSGSFTVRINVSPDEQAIVKQTPLINTPVQQTRTTPQTRQTVILADGLHLRSALLKRGHTAGYSPDEITAEERKRGFTFPPELKFYRTLVREGVVTQVGGKDILASSLQADFGATSLGVGTSSQTHFGATSLHKVPWKAPSTNAVQAVLNHHLWVEIAHSDSHLYAFDMAPGPDGTTGQIIARRIGEVSVPVRVARSLAQFVTGESLSNQVAGESSSETPQSDTPFGKTIAWVGTVTPTASPTLLGWPKTPDKTQRHEVRTPKPGGAFPASTKTGKHSAARPPAKQPPAPVKDVTAVEPSAPKETTDLLRPKEPALNNQAPFLTVDTEPIPRYEPRSRGLSTPDREPPSGHEALRAGHHVYKTGKAAVPQKRDEPRVDDVVQFDDIDSIIENDIENLDSGIIYTPVSPEQKDIATAIGTLAFGTKEEREEYRPTDTSPILALETRGKKLSLTSAPPGELATQREGKQAENNLRSTLRKLFNGGNHV